MSLPIKIFLLVSGLFYGGLLLYVVIHGAKHGVGKAMSIFSSPWVYIPLAFMLGLTAVLTLLAIVLVLIDWLSTSA